MSKGKGKVGKGGKGGKVERKERKKFYSFSGAVSFLFDFRKICFKRKKPDLERAMGKERVTNLHYSFATISAENLLKLSNLPELGKVILSSFLSCHFLFVASKNLVIDCNLFVRNCAM